MSQAKEETKTNEVGKELTKREKEEERKKIMIILNAKNKLTSVKNMKEALKKNGVKFPSNAGQQELQKLFYSHNLKINEKDLEEEIAKAEAKEKEKAVAKAQAKAQQAEAKAQAKAQAKAEAVAEAEAKSKPLTEPKEEVVLTLNIKAHGGESTEFPPSSPISKYYKNNVRVHSMACVPGVLAYSHIGTRYNDVEGSYSIFSRKAECATEEIMKEYSTTKTYYKDMMDGWEKNDDINRRCAYANKERSAKFTTFLSKKTFSFENSKLENEHMKRLSELETKKFMESWGVNVSDIRLKITNIDGSVRYRQIFNPSHERRKHIDMHGFKESDPNFLDKLDRTFDITRFNLRYRKGIEFILKDVLHKEELIPSILQIFKFKDGQDRISEINLEQLYEFFKLVEIKFVNVIDSSCRYFPPELQMTGENTEKLYSKEQKFNKKPEGFGKRSRKLSNRKRSYKLGRKLSNRKRSNRKLSA
jgi:hypothetical protein